MRLPILRPYAGSLHNLQFLKRTIIADIKKLPEYFTLFYNFRTLGEIH